MHLCTYQLKFHNCKKVTRFCSTFEPIPYCSLPVLNLGSRTTSSFFFCFLHHNPFFFIIQYSFILPSLRPSIKWNYSIPHPHLVLLHTHTIAASAVGSLFVIVFQPKWKVLKHRSWPEKKNYHVLLRTQSTRHRSTPLLLLHVLLFGKPHTTPCHVFHVFAHAQIQTTVLFPIQFFGPKRSHTFVETHLSHFIVQSKHVAHLQLFYLLDECFILHGCGDRQDWFRCWGHRQPSPLLLSPHIFNKINEHEFK